VSVLFDNIDLFAKGFWLTLQVCILSAIGAVIIGTIVAVLRISPIPPLRWLGTAYVTVFRNAPLTVVFFLAAFGLPALGSNAEFLNIPGLNLLFSRLDYDLPYFRFAVFALMIYTGAFVCEALRSGVNAVPPGQAEAARAMLTLSRGELEKMAESSLRVVSMSRTCGMFSRMTGSSPCRSAGMIVLIGRPTISAAL